MYNFQLDLAPKQLKTSPMVPELTGFPKLKSPKSQERDKKFFSKSPEYSPRDVVDKLPKIKKPPEKYPSSPYSVFSP